MEKFFKKKLFQEIKTLQGTSNVKDPIYQEERIGELYKRMEEDEFTNIPELENLLLDHKYGTSLSKLKETLKVKVSDLETTIEESLKNNLNEEEKEIIDFLKQLPYDYYFVGGCVRDACLGLRIKDFDIATNASIDFILNEASRKFEVDARGKHFKVIVIRNGTSEIEVAEFRKDSQESDGRRPESVVGGTLEEDAMRRDFTVNAGFVNIKNLNLTDPTTQFVDDILSGTLRFIGNAEDRIRNDYLRVFRFYRFIATKGLKADKKSLSAVRRMMKEALCNIDSNRATNEIERMIVL